MTFLNTRIIREKNRRKEEELATIMRIISIIFATLGMHVPLDIHYCDIDQQHRSLELHWRYTLLSYRSIRGRHVIHNSKPANGNTLILYYYLSLMYR